MAQHKWAKEIHAWADGAEIEWALSDKPHEWITCKNQPSWGNDNLKFRIKPQQKCIVKGCENHTHEGKFVGELCAPCWDYIANGKGVHSQAYRNTQPKEPQYLYVYADGNGITFSGNDFASYEGRLQIGKIKLENDDE